MRYSLSILLFTVIVFSADKNFAQCSITNATTCVCANGTGDCDLLPDLTISWYGLQNYSGGPTEYPQTGAGANNGQLRVTGSTPNIGYGPFSVQAEQNGEHWFVCGTDTFQAPASQNFVCPNGSVAKQILWQRIYHKAGTVMSYWDRIAGAMTYEQGSMHVDDWGTMSLRIENPLEPNPLNWTIVGTGRKQSFCLMDYGSCSTYNGHCRDDQSVFNQGTTLLTPDFPNYGLGNSYGCSSVEQGCTVGYTDIYNESLTGMFIDIPPGTCNGNYWIVYEIDPHNNFLEMDENNNYTLMPFTLTQQVTPGNPVSTISADKNLLVCGNDSVTLTANAGWDYHWSTGATNRSIKVGAGTYDVTLTTNCGTAQSVPVVITSIAPPSIPLVTSDTVCSGFSATLLAMGSNISWYDLNSIEVGSGNTFTTPLLLASTVYYAVDKNTYPGILSNGAKLDSLGGGAYFAGVQYEIFDALNPFVLRSVQVFANGAGPRTIELYNSSGAVLESVSVNIPNGPSRVNLNFNVPEGTSLRLGATGTPNLWRNNAGVIYPYTIADTLSVTGSSAGDTFYYFFYDWEIETGSATCSSAPVMVNAIVETCTGIDPAADLSENLRVYPNPSKNIFHLELLIPGQGSNIDIRVFDMTGRNIYVNNFKEVYGLRETDIDLSKFGKGIYHLEIIVAGRRYIKRLVVA